MSARRYSLTRREGQLVSLLSQGLKNKEIATALTISEGTVKVYLSRLFQKLGVKDRFELALYGLKNLTPGGGTGKEPRQAAKNRLRPSGSLPVRFSWRECRRNRRHRNRNAGRNSSSKGCLSPDQCRVSASVAIVSDRGIQGRRALSAAVRPSGPP